MHRLVNGQKQILFAVGKLEILIRSQEGTPAGVPGPDNLEGEPLAPSEAKVACKALAAT